MKNMSLQDVCSGTYRQETIDYQLTEDDIDQITSVICQGFESSSYDFKRCLEDFGQGSYCHGIYSRVVKSSHGWELVAAQDYELEQQAVIAAMTEEDPE